MASNANIRDVYELVERVRLELKQDMTNAVAAISHSQGEESGRLKRVESDIGELKVQQATMVTKLGVLGFIASCIVGSLVSIAVPRLIK